MPANAYIDRFGAMVFFENLEEARRNREEERRRLEVTRELERAEAERLAAQQQRPTGCIVM